MYSSSLKSSGDEPPPPPEGATFGVFIAPTTACPIPDTIPVLTDVNTEAVSDATAVTMSEATVVCEDVFSFSNVALSFADGCEGAHSCELE